jgi:hypothetical protein
MTATLIFLKWLFNLALRSELTIECETESLLIRAGNGTPLEEGDADKLVTIIQNESFRVGALSAVSREECGILVQVTNA